MHRAVDRATVLIAWRATPKEVVLAVDLGVVSALRDEIGGAPNVCDIERQASDRGIAPAQPATRAIEFTDPLAHPRWKVWTRSRSTAWRAKLFLGCVVDDDAIVTRGAVDLVSRSELTWSATVL